MKLVSAFLPLHLLTTIALTLVPIVLALAVCAFIVVWHKLRRGPRLR